MERPQISDELLLKAVEAATVALGKKIEKHGRGAYVSNHETYGITAEEWHELMGALQNNDPVSFAEESMDVAAALIFGLASQFEKEERLKAAAQELEEKVAEMQSSLT